MGAACEQQGCQGKSRAFHGCLNSVTAGYLQAQCVEGRPRIEAWLLRGGRDRHNGAVPIELRIKRIETGELLIAEFESFEDAKTWAAERPDMIEVLGVVDPKAVGEAAFRELQEATRPLDRAETDRRHEAMEADLARMREADERESLVAGLVGRIEPSAPEPAPDPSSLPDAEPDAVMVIRWQYKVPMANISDNRPISPVVRAAVQAWVAERNEWLHPKRAHVGRVELRVRPGEMSTDEEAERIEPVARFSELPGWPE